MKVKSIIEKPRSKKKYMFYCYECGSKKLLYMGRHWCCCNIPEFQMGLSSPQELEQQSKDIDNWFKNMGVRVISK